MAQEPRKLSVQAVHLVRTATQTNLTLSQMADQKASILMGATFVVFTIAVGQARTGAVPLTLLVLAGFAFLSAMCAVAAILPSIATKTTSGMQPNLLFFGTFTQLCINVKPGINRRRIGVCDRGFDRALTSQ